MKRILFAVLVLMTAVAARADRTPYTRNVAVVIYEDAEPLDWTGPYEVWNDASEFGSVSGAKAFHVYTVAATKAPLNAQGLKVIPDYSIDDAPKPDVIIIPGGAIQHVTENAAFMKWLKSSAEGSEITQTVCTGAFAVAETGLLDHLQATTWYNAVEPLQKQHPQIQVIAGRRFVDNGKFVTTAGISAGIDGSLHLVARLLGRKVADDVARYMEYHWTPESYLAKNYQYLNPSTDDRGRLIQTAEMRRDEKNFADAAAIYRKLLGEDAANDELWFALGRTLQQTDDHAGAAAALVHASEASGHRGSWSAYLAAVEFAKAGQKDRAVELLVKAWNAGHHELDAINAEPALAGVRVDSRFTAAVAHTSTTASASAK
ncbi:MAG: DJ-1/PfpI family protein [Acidobacteria bacterium]|nr:DJ-1/PfpI family protein [Acidobacteriota bacterium]MBV9474666.1 DJ-1/PfpI family protein [Acidobacteriota bacterium]